MKGDIYVPVCVLRLCMYGYKRSYFTYIYVGIKKHQNMCIILFKSCWNNKTKALLLKVYHYLH